MAVPARARMRGSGRGVVMPAIFWRAASMTNRKLSSAATGLPGRPKTGVWLMRPMTRGRPGRSFSFQAWASVGSDMP